MSSSLYIDNKGKDVSLFPEVPTQGLDDTTWRAEDICKWEHLKEAIPKRKILSIRKKSY